MVERYAKRDGYTVIATARDPKSMPKVETGSGSKVIVVTMDQAKPKGCLDVSGSHITFSHDHAHPCRLLRRSSRMASPNLIS
jgi:hypothetical protein